MNIDDTSTDSTLFFLSSLSERGRIETEVRDRVSVERKERGGRIGGKKRTYCSSSAKDARGSELAALNPVLELPMPFRFSFPFSTVCPLKPTTVS